MIALFLNSLVHSLYHLFFLILWRFVIQYQALAWECLPTCVVFSVHFTIVKPFQPCCCSFHRVLIGILFLKLLQFSNIYGCKIRVKNASLFVWISPPSSPTAEISGKFTSPASNSCLKIALSASASLTVVNLSNDSYENWQRLCSSTFSSSILNSSIK